MHSNIDANGVCPGDRFQRRAIEKFEAALAIYTELDDHTEQALTLHRLSSCYKELRQFAKAAQLLDQALAIQRPSMQRPPERLRYVPTPYVAPRSLPAYTAVRTNEPPSEFFAGNLQGPAPESAR